MNIDELIKYIVSRLKAGANADDIVSQLRNAGWTEDAVNSAFVSARQQLNPVPQFVAENNIASPSISYQPQFSQPAATEMVVPSGRNSIKAGWILFKQSFGVIKQNPVLWRYLVMSLVWGFGIIALMFAAVSTSVIIFGKMSDSRQIIDILSLIIFVVFGYISTVVTYYYTTALSINVLALFRGEQITYKDCILKSRKKLPAIMVYSLITVGVGYILRLIEDKFKLLGSIISRILGLAWALATTFTLPVIADSDASGSGCIKQSVSLFKDTWGETITSKVTLGGLIVLVYFFVMFPISIVAILLLMETMGVGIVFVSMGIFLLGIILISIVQSLASTVLNVALYYYARYKIVPSVFSAESLSSALVAKKR